MLPANGSALSSLYFLNHSLSVFTFIPSSPEALDRNVKKPQENPSVVMLLCKNADTDVIEYSLSRNLSQTMIAEYETKLIDKAVLQRKLAELYDIAEELQNSQQD